MRKAFIVGMILVIGFILPALAQDIKTTFLEVKSGSVYILPVPQVKAIALKCNSCIIEGAFFVVEGDTVEILEDSHEPHSALVLVQYPVDTLSFYSGKIVGAIELFFIDAGTVSPKDKPSLRMKGTECEIAAVTPEIWRQGLEPPSYTPGVTDVEHLVIHHSATSNIITDPIETVRSIYSYHTQINGWSDIGYNYLIAPDGTVFQGRDHMGVADADNIIGAHMCGVNSKTMGICMLGTFTDVLPTASALNALAALIKWKTQKEEISVFGSEVHAIGPPSANIPPQDLPNVCGHRDGCRTSYTECPGDLLYQNLSEVRKEASLFVCQPEEEAVNLTAYPNPTSTGVNVDFTWTDLEIIDVRGRLIRTYPNQQEDISLKLLTKGVYLLYFDTPEHGKLVRKVVKL